MEGQPIGPFVSRDGIKDAQGRKSFCQLGEDEEELNVGFVFNGISPDDVGSNQPTDYNTDCTIAALGDCVSTTEGTCSGTNSDRKYYDFDHCVCPKDLEGCETCNLTDGVLNKTSGSCTILGLNGTCSNKGCAISSKPNCWNLTGTGFCVTEICSDSNSLFYYDLIVKDKVLDYYQEDCHYATKCNSLQRYPSTSTVLFTSDGYTYSVGDTTYYVPCGGSNWSSSGGADYKIIIKKTR